MTLHHPRLQVDPHQPMVVTADRTYTWGQVDDMAAQYRVKFNHLSKQRIGLTFHADGNGLATLSALQALGCNIFLLPLDASDDYLQDVATRFELTAIVKLPLDQSHEPELILTGVDASKSQAESGITILTSGTTGTPKAARHTLESLSKPTRVHESFLQTKWLLCYRPNLYAGLQVILQCLVNGGQLVVPNHGASPEQVAQLSADAGVQYASATPSYWRWLLTFAPKSILSTIPFKQITLGGEIVDQHILSRLDALFPDARLVHIYATTELGRCFSVTDKQAGFPSKFLDKPSPDGVAMKIENGELMVKSANAMLNYDPRCGQKAMQSDWCATGDLVKEENGRCYFMGRRHDMINVGGNKVSPVKVEETMMQLDGIDDIRVYARKSSIMGQLVACDIVAATGFDQAQLRQHLKAHCAEHLNDYETPQLIKFVQTIQTSAAMKKVRH